MRRFFSSILLLTYIGFFTLSPFVSAQGAPVGDATKTFEIIVPETGRVNEAFSVTVKALNPVGWAINTTFIWTIDFAVTLWSAPAPAGSTIPHNIDGDATELGYTFTLDDQGQHTFPVAFKFPSPGNYTVAVIDETDGEVKDSKNISITAGGTLPPTTEPVTITDPVAQMTLSEDTVTVRGTSKATSAIDLSVNGVKNSSTLTNIDGHFEGVVTGLVEGTNTIKADVLDGSNISIGSAEVIVLYSLDAPKINSLVVKEGNQIFAGSIINLVAIWDQGLKTVTVKFGSQNVVLEEDVAHLGTYKGKVTVTSFEGEIKPVVSAESYTGGRADFPDLYNINIITAIFENVKAEGTPDKKARFTFSVKPDLEEIKYFKIKYGNTSWSLDKDVTTFEKSQMKDGEQYTWYIPGISNGEYFATIIALDKDKNELSIKSDELTFSILDSGTTCYIDQVSGVTVKVSGKVSIISWDKLDDAVTYQIFKKDAAGEYTMIDEVTETSYKVDIDMTAEEEVFEDFQIRATCKNGDMTGEGAYSESVSVQTWPVAIMFMIFMIASGTAFILMRRGYLK